MQINNDNQYQSIDYGSVNKNYLLNLKAEKTYQMVLTFTPVADTDYNFDLPFYIHGKDKNPLFIKKVKCKGSKPKFLMEPLNGVEFARKIIITSDTVVPEYKSLTFSNPDFDKTLIWKFDSDIINNQKIFSVTPTSGLIEP